MTPVLYYGLFLALGSAVSAEDWSRRKIRNRWVLLGLSACAAGLLWLLLNSLLGARHLTFWGAGRHYLPLRYYPAVALHLLLSLCAGFGLWRLSVWPAGDAKFYLVCAFFLALIDPNLPGFPGLLFLLVLINIFVPAGLVFAAETLVKGLLRLPELGRVDWPTWRKAKAEMALIRLREAWPYRVGYLMLAVNVFALFLALQALQARFPAFAGPWTPLAVFLLMSLAWPRLVGLLQGKAVGLAFFAVVCAAALWSAAGPWSARPLLAAAGRMTFNFGVFLSAARAVAAWAIERDSLRELRAEDLVAGAMLSDETWAVLSAEPALAKRLGERRVDGLSEGDAGALKAWLAARAPGGHTVYRTIPFAVWIFLGALLTLSGLGNVVAVLARRLG